MSRTDVHTPVKFAFPKYWEECPDLKGHYIVNAPDRIWYGKVLAHFSRNDKWSDLATKPKTRAQLKRDALKEIKEEME